MSDDSILCSNPDCAVAEDGRCIEGLSLDACPNYGRRPTLRELEQEAADEPIRHYELAPSLVLAGPDASLVLAARASRVVAVVATYDAGKTSLVAAVYDAFQRGPLAGMSFAGSSTLHSFEVACHDSRSASRRTEATIFRTPRGDARYYHLDLRPTGGGAIIGLLLADRAGEEYVAVASDVVDAAPLFEVRRADVVTLLVDGARLVDSKERHNVRAEIEGIVQGLLDGGALTGRQRLAVVLTKDDAVKASPRADSAHSDFDRLLSVLEGNFGGDFVEIAGLRTAASPKTAEAVRGEGLADLLAYWLRPVSVSAATAPVPSWPKRDFDRLREVEHD
ncbi:hypothetical protein [uncultured Aureimonas sp.]|uniref:TRAFAC clade GTPase domain-containing protein n=1 Tax=uncultured Aureimonas sp. TaxID=1604662 RepID=UPI0025E03E39|nr:hypothetical protein [uncultured Aureimonas sp.]